MIQGAQTYKACLDRTLPRLMLSQPQPYELAYQAHLQHRTMIIFTTNTTIMNIQENPVSFELGIFKGRKEIVMCPLFAIARSIAVWASEHSLLTPVCRTINKVEPNISDYNIALTP